MSRNQTSGRDNPGYGRNGRDDRDRREPRDQRNTVQRERETGSRTPAIARTLAESRTIESRSAMDTRGGPLADPRDARIDTRDARDSRNVIDPRTDPRSVDSRTARDPRDALYDREGRPIIDSGDPRAAGANRDPRPGALRDSRDRDSRDRLQETPVGGTPTNDYFLPGEDISREVITADICRYLGPDALVRPYTHKDGRKGFLITAYRALTTPMINSLKQDSRKFELENKRRLKEGRGAQSYAPASYDQPGRGGVYADDRDAVGMSRGDSRYSSDPDPRRSQPPARYDEDMDLDPPMDQRDTRYGRVDPYDSRDSRPDPRARPPVTSGYAPPGRDPYTAYDSRADPRGDPRDPRSYPVQAGNPLDRDYDMLDARPIYSDASRGQQLYAPGRPDQYQTISPVSASSIPRSRDEGPIYVDRHGNPITVPLSSSRPMDSDRYAASGRDERGMDYDRRYR